MAPPPPPPSSKTLLPVGGVENKQGVGTKLDTGKVRVDLVPMLAHWEMCRVLTKGAERYGANNWRSVIGWRWRYLGAALRHIFQFMMGKKYDVEGPHPTNLHHLACALCSLYFVLDNELTLEAGGTVPDGDAVPGGAEDLKKSLEKVLSVHKFQPRDSLAYGSPCVVCGEPGVHPNHEGAS